LKEGSSELWYPVPTYTNGTLNPEFLQPVERHLTRDIHEGRDINYCHVEFDLACPELGCLQGSLYGGLPGFPFPTSLMNAVRFTVGGLQLDPFAGSADPIWWLAAANFDRLWALCKLS
jgi:hypothetical protein